jgi:predicted nucleic acid-binding protein
VLLDSTVLIDVLRGHPAAERLRAARASGARFYVCAVNVEEVVRGLRPDDMAVARALFAGLRTVPLRETEGRRAGEWRRDFGLRGVTLSQADCLIAAAALTVGGRLATGNPRHFPMPELAVEHWHVGA